MDHPHGWYCSRCGHWNYHYESYCHYCSGSSPYNYSFSSFFAPTLSTYNHPHVHNKEYKKNSSERSDSDNLFKSSKELEKLKKILDLQIQLVYKAIERKEAQNDLLNTLEKVKNKIQKIEESNGDYQKTLSLIGELTAALSKKNNTSDLTKIKSLQLSAEVEGRISDYQELHEIINLLTGTKILGTLDVEKSEEDKSEEKKEKKEKKGEKDKKGEKGEKDDNIPSDPQTLIEDISEQWEKGNFDSVQESLENLKNLESLESLKKTKGLEQNISDSKRYLKELIDRRNEIIKLIDEIKSEKLKGKINISNEEPTEDELLEELDEDDDD